MMNHKEIMEALLSGKRLHDAGGYLELRNGMLMAVSESGEHAHVIEHFVFELHNELYAKPNNNVEGTWAWAQHEMLECGRGVRRSHWVPLEHIKASLDFDKFVEENGITYFLAPSDLQATDWSVVK